MIISIIRENVIQASFRNQLVSNTHGYSLTSHCSHCRIPATTVEMYQPKSRRWSALHHTTDGFWVFGSDPVDKPVVTPFHVRLTAANGDVVEDHIPSLGNDGKSYQR